MILDFFQELENYGRIDTIVSEDIQDVFEVINGKNKLNLFHLNIRSLKKNFEELLIYLNLFNFENVDILILSETFNLDKVSDFHIKGYNLYYNESTFNKNDGLVIYVKENINVRTSTFKLNQTNILRLTFEINNSKYGVTACYRPPSTNLNLFLDELDDIITNLVLKNTEIFIGDLNINILNKDDIDVNRYLNILSQKGFFSCINKPSRETEVSSSIIDHIFIKTDNIDEKKLDIKPIIFQTSLTDHYTLTLSLHKIEYFEKNVQKTNYKRIIDYTKLNNMLCNETWDDVMGCNDIEESYIIFKNKIQRYIETNSKIKKINSAYRKRKPWVTEGIINSIKHRDELKKQLLRNFSINLNLNYKKYRNTLNKIIKLAKSLYYKTKIQEAKNEYKQVWNIINDFTYSQKKGSTKNINITDNQGNIIKDDKEKAELFNNFFINIGTELKNKIPKTNINFSGHNKTLNSLYLTPVTENELIIHIGSLKNNSAPGEDNISSFLIKAIHKNIIKPLLYLINLSFSSSNIPSDWKTSLVTPVYKKGDPNLLTNYRPISLINNFAKLFEKCLKTRLVDFLEKESIFYKNQFGFRKNKSTEDAVFEVVNEIITTIGSKIKCLALYLDLTKAFDTVSHTILYERLKEVGVRGGPLQLLQNYLTNRVQKVKINENVSSGQIITTGVPQGTVLGPILFLVYINEIGNLPINGRVVSYADDTTILFSAEKWQDVYRQAEVSLSIVLQWLNTSLLSLNLTKTYFMSFSASAADQPTQNTIKIHKAQCKKNDLCSCPIIERTNKIQYLGVIIDQHLRWNEHANYISSKIRKMYYKFYQSREILNKKILIILYNALVESLIRYCIVIWGCLYKNALKILSVCQNTTLKIIFRKDRMYPTTLLYKNYNILNVRSLYVLCSVNYITKIKHLCPTISHNYQTRSNFNELLTIPSCSSSITQRFITYYAPKILNMLPSSLRNLISNKKQFRNQTKKYILQNSEKFIKLFQN